MRYGFELRSGLLALALTLSACGTTQPADVQEQSAAEQPTIAMVDSELLPVGDSPIRGAADAWVTLVVFGDFQCPFCGRLAATLDQVLAEQPQGRARLVFKHVPLDSHPHARLFARASEAAREQGKFWEMHDLLFDRAAELREGNPQAELRRLAGELDLDVEKFERDLADPKLHERVARDEALAEELGLEAVPAVYINGGYIPGAQPPAVYMRAIYDVGEATRGAVEDGEMKREEVYAHSVRALLPRSQQAQAAQAEQESAQARIARVPVYQPGRPVLGDDDEALVQIAHFHSLGSEPSVEMHRRLAELQAGDPQRIRVVTFQLPHSDDEVLAFAHRALAAASHDDAARGQQFLSWLAELPEDAWSQGPELLERIDAKLKELGVDPERVNSDESRARLAADQRLAIELDVVGIPTTFINGQRVVGLAPLDELKRQVEEKVAIAERVAQVRNISGQELYEAMLDAAEQQPAAR
ncbi:DsbA family protein [Lujinxingia vulgaris]|nr:DsbA family protein [Lujinxingia vulgaris]